MRADVIFVVVLLTVIPPTSFGDWLQRERLEGTRVQAATPGNPSERTVQIPLQFVENRGQFHDSDVKFACQGPVSALFTDTGVSFRVMYGKGLSSERSERLQVYRMDFDRARPTAPLGEQPLSQRSNYFIGNDSSIWASGISAYGGIRYNDLYAGIDLIFRSSPYGLKYEFVVRPGGCISDIRLKYTGAELRVDGNELVIITPAGEVRDGDFMAYEMVDDARIPVDAQIVVDGTTVSYRANHDPGRTLVIDPLVFSTFIGGTGWEACLAIALGPTGDCYATGFTMATDFPTTPGAYDSTYADRQDVFVLRLSSDGSSLIYSTYFGGSGQEWGYDIQVDAQGEAYVCGYTESSDLPTTASAYDSTFNGADDAFILKLSADGSRLLYSTFIGGYWQDDAESIAVDQQGNAYITGTTGSSDFPTTSGAFDQTYNSWDAYVAKLSADGSSLSYSTFVGSDTVASSYGIVVDSVGNAYVATSTSSATFPTTPGAVQQSINGNFDGVVFGLNAQGSALLFSTFFGGSTSDSLVGICRDSSGDLYIAGLTYSMDITTTANAFDPSYNGGETDGFVFKLNGNGTRLLYSTYLGGSGLDEPTDIALDSRGNAYISGYTDSADFPVTQTADQASLAGRYDAFVAKLNTEGTSQIYSTFLGAESNDQGFSIAVDSGNNITIAGDTVSPDFPNTTGAYDTTYNGLYDLFVARLTARFPPRPPREPAAATGDGYVNLSWKYPLDDGGQELVGYTLYREIPSQGGPFSPLVDLPSERNGYNDTNVTNGIIYIYAVLARNAQGASNLTENVTAMPGAVPSEPWGLRAQSRNNSITLSWYRPNYTSGLPLLKFKIYSGVRANPLELIDEVADASSYLDRNVTNGVTYYYRLSAVNPIGEGPSSDEITGLPSDLPSAPVGLSAVFDPGPGEVRLRWLTPSFLGSSMFVVYRVYRGDGSESALLTETENVCFNDSTVLAGHEYEYSVSAVNPAGEGPRSMSVNLSVGYPPAAPSAVIARELEGMVQLSWNAPAETGGFPVSGYRVFRGLVPGDTTQLAETYATEYSDGNVTNGMVYYYSVAAWNRIGEGPTNGTRAVPHGLPSAVQNLSARVEGKTVRLLWGPPQDDGGGALEYFIVRMNGNEVGHTCTTFYQADIDDWASSPFRFSISAVSVYGEGTPSLEIPVALPVAAFSASPAVGNISTDFIFSSISTATAGSIVDWNWDFGDRTGGTGEVVTHRYARPGNYSANLTVQDSLGGRASFSLPVEVLNRPPRIDHVAPQDPAPRLPSGGQLEFTVDAVDDDGDALTYHWYLDDKIAGDAANFTFLAPGKGLTNVRVVVSDGTDSVEQEWKITVTAPKGGTGPGALSLTVVLLAAIMVGVIAALVGALAGRRSARKGVTP